MQYMNIKHPVLITHLLWACRHSPTKLHYQYRTAWWLLRKCTYKSRKKLIIHFPRSITRFILTVTLTQVYKQPHPDYNLAKYSLSNIQHRLDIRKLSANAKLDRRTFKTLIKNRQFMMMSFANNITQTIPIHDHMTISTKRLRLKYCSMTVDGTGHN